MQGDTINTPWEVQRTKASDSYYFVGEETKKLTKKISKIGALLDSEGSHLAPGDLMDEYGNGLSPNSTLSALDIAILKDLGYSSKTPKWWPKTYVAEAIDPPDYWIV
jgi:hypothetical protein